MPLFSYEATSAQGKKITGQQEAPARDDVAALLHEQGLVVISIEEKLNLSFSKLSEIEIGGVSLKDKVVLVKQLSTMLGAGLPMLQSLNILVQQTESKSLQNRLTDVFKDVEAGTSLSVAFRKEGSLFSELQLSLLEAGEKSGTLNEIMEQIAIDLEKSKALKSKITNAMIYPVIIFFVMGLVFILLIVFMIPSVKDLYADFGVDELPGVTQVLIDLSDAIANPLGLITLVLTIVSSIAGIRYYYTTEHGRRVVDKLLLKLPIFGKLQTKMQLTQFARLFSMLLESGVPIIESLQTVSNSMSNSLFKDAIADASQEVLKGSSLALPLAKSGVFPLILLKMVATGEETGKLDKIMGDMGLFYEKEVNEITDNLTKLMEPLILLIVGVMVGFMAVAIYLPLYSLGQFVD